MPRSLKIADDDDDDVPARVGRPRAKEEFGPPRPEQHERQEYAARLQLVLKALEIPDLGRDERMYLQRILWRRDQLRKYDRKRFAARGEDQVVLLLRSIAEMSNSLAALKLSIMRALSLCLHEAWTSKGLAWLDAMDAVKLVEIEATLRGLGLGEHLHTAIRWKLAEILGPPIVSQPMPKTPARKMVKPPAVSQAAWDDVIQIGKLRKKKTAEPRATRKKSPVAKAA